MNKVLNKDIVEKMGPPIKKFGVKRVKNIFKSSKRVPKFILEPKGQFFNG